MSPSELLMKVDQEIYTFSFIQIDEAEFASTNIQTTTTW